MNPSGLAKKSAFVFSYNIVGGVLGYITMFFALRLVGQSAWGIFGSALALSGILGILANLGVESTHIKKLTQKRDKEECMGAIVVLKSFLGIIFLSGSFLLFFILSDFFGYKFESVYLRDATYLALFGILIGSFANIFKTTYQAKLSARRAVIPMFVQLLVQNLLIILFSFLYVFNRNVIPEIVGVLFIYAYVLGQFARLLIYSMWAIRDRLSFKRPSKSLLKDYILFSIPLALSGIVATIQAYTDRAMLLFFWNYNEVGGYFTVQKLALFITYFGASVSFFLYPTQSHYYEKDKREDFQRITVKSERYLSLISVPFVFFTLVMSTEILNIFRASLTPYAIPLIILMIYAYLNVINRPYGSQITSANKPQEVMKVGFLQATLNVLLNALFIPTSIWGIPLLGLKSTGAALATLLSFIIGFVYFRYRIAKSIKTKYYHRIVLHILAGSISAVAIYLLKNYTQYIVNWYAWYTVVASFVIFSGIYLGILYLLKEIGKEEINMALGIIRPKD